MKNIKISDITLREASRSRALPFKGRVEIARTLDRLRLDVIELPPIRDEKADVLSNKTIASVVTGSILSAATGLTEESVAAAPGCTSWYPPPRCRWSTSATRRLPPCWSW